MDVTQEFIEVKKGSSFVVMMEEIRNEIINCKFEPGLPELHQILGATDDEFVQYVFECVKDELQSVGFIFTQIDFGKWEVTKPSKRA